MRHLETSLEAEATKQMPNQEKNYTLQKKIYLLMKNVTYNDQKRKKEKK